MDEELSVLFSEEQIKLRIQELAQKINNDYKDSDIVMICILKGAVYFACDLSRRINNNVTLEFIKITSYTGTETNKEPRIDYDLKSSIEGKDVLIVEDILDTGCTLDFLVKILKLKNPKSIKICTLLDKDIERDFSLKPDYVGFKIDNYFVLGYGLDYNEEYRNLPNICYKKTKRL